MDILCEMKRQDVKEHPNLEWNLYSTKKVSLKPQQIISVACARTDILQVRSSEKWTCASAGMDIVGNEATATEEI